MVAKDRWTAARGSLAWLLGALLQLLTAQVEAQVPGEGEGSSPSNETGQQTPAAGPDAAQGPVLRPPSLLTFAPAEYPQEAAEAGLQGEVLLELVIDASGKVSESTVVQSAGHGFDEAARAASLNLVFQPATRDGEPIPARVRFPYVFELDVVEEPEEPEAPPPAALTGQVLDPDRDPVPQVRVEVIAPDGTAQLALTDEAGRFSLSQLPPGTYAVRLTSENYEERISDEDLLPGQSTDVVYELSEKPDADAYGAVARVPPPPREVTRRSIGRTQLTRIPGTRGDALRAVELLPGVARPPFGAGALIVRGSAPQDSQVQLEGAPLPLLYHFGGLTSVFNSQLLESVEFFPGNFSTRYGRRRGGIVEVNVRDPKRDGYAGLLDINLLDAYGVLEGPITDDWEFALAFRRSYVDLVFEAVIPEDEVSVIAAPVYYDYQAITTYHPSDRDKLRLMIFGSSDRFAILFAEPADETGGATDLDLSTVFNRAHLTWSRKVSDDVDHDLELAIDRTYLNFGLGDELGFMLRATNMVGRSEWRARLSDQLRLIGGLDVLVVPGRIEYQGPVVGQSEGAPENMGMSLSGRDFITRERNFLAVQPAAYAELDINLFPLRLVPGIRLDYYSLIDEYTFDPRLTAIYTASPDTRLKAGIGMFSQPPQPQEADKVLGNPNLDPMKTIHTALGVEHDVTEGINLGAEAFYKHLYDLVVGTEFGGDPAFVNAGAGRIYGLELSAKVEPRGRFFGYLSYTLSRSERRDVRGGYRLFDFDQTHILTVSSVYRLGAGWELGGTFRLVSGNPNTPVVGSVTNLDTDTATPIYGATNSDRNAMFHRLDVLVRKTWDFDFMKFMVYLDVQNIYNRQNPEGVVYGPRFKVKQTIGGLPLLPNLGLRGEF